jgi:predicted permease
VINQQITVNGQQLTIVGVGPKNFNGTTLGARPFLYVPITMRTALNPGFRGFDRRNDYWVYLFARLKPGVSLQQSLTAINTIYTPIINDVEVPLQKGIERADARQVQIEKVDAGRRPARSEPNAEGSEDADLHVVLDHRIVLLIACANIANLLLARAANRMMEMAVRLSLGATRRQLIAQVLTESVLLAALGGVVSVVVANWTLNGITAMLPPEATTTMDFSLSTMAVVFTGVLSLGTGILFGVVPALQSTRPDLVTELRNNSGKLSGGRGAARFRTSLVTAQIALSMALLISAGLFIKSLRNISRVDLGVTIDNMVTFGISPSLSGYDTTRARALYSRVEEELAALPGVTGVTAAMVPLLAGNNWGQGVSVEGSRRIPIPTPGLASMAAARTTSKCSAFRFSRAATSRRATMRARSALPS